MRLLASTDYALRLLMCLAGTSGERRSSEELAEAIGVPRNHVQKIVQDLAEAGFVRTQRGRDGGVTLARDPAAISIGAVVRVLEAEQALVECFRADGGTCRLAPSCRLRGALARAREAFLASLDPLSLADVLAPDVLAPVVRLS